MFDISANLCALGSLGYAAGEYANACKYWAAEMAFTACETAVCSMGGMGYAKE